MSRRLTTVLAPRPSSPRGAARDLSPTPPRRYKSLCGRSSPLFHPHDTSSSVRPRTAPHLAPSTSYSPWPTGALPPPPGLSLPPPSFPLPSGERCPRSPSDQVAMPLTFLSFPSCYWNPPPSPKLAGAPPPSKKRRRAAPSANSSSPNPLREPCQHPSCPATSPHHPRARATDRATPRPPVKPRRPRHDAWPPHGDSVVRVRSVGWHGLTRPLCCWARPTVSGLGLKCRPSTVWHFF
jgi:hypothetical protein